MLKNWPEPGSKIELTRDIEIEGERVVAGTQGELRRYLVEKREREYSDDRFIVKVAGRIATVERADIRLTQ